MPIVIRAFPVSKGKDEVIKFAEEMRQRSSEVDAFYKRFGVSREAWFWQETPQGALIIALTEAADLTEAPEAYAKADDAFESWFKSKSMEISGINLNETPLGPPSELLFDWTDKEKGK